jgi:eukaryotic-like serine/threonine-protein kinase
VSSAFRLFWIRPTEHCLLPRLKSAMQNHRAGCVRLREFEVDLRAGELFAAGTGNGRRKILLRQQPFEVLRMLIEAGGEIVTRQEMKKTLWPNDTIVNFDHSINVAIGILRRIMGDSADNPQYIETLGRRGYRLRVPVEWLEAENESAMPQPLNTLSPGVPASLIGAKVSHYRILEFIGAGGMGMVYKAEDLKLARRVALKFLPDELANDPLARKRFEREAQTASALNHPNICTIYDTDEFDGQPFIAMELLEGDSLDRLATPEETASPPGLLLDIAIQVCAGLQAAHDEGIIHRDIKPGNLFLTRRGQVKILDFGLAQAAAAEELVAGNFPEAHIDSSESSGTRSDNESPRIPTAVQAAVPRTEPPMGTTGYMSPEQLRKEHLDPRTDLFSLGIVLYEMTTGWHPFRGASLVDVHEAILTQSPLPAHDVNPTVPHRLSAVISKVTEKDRSRRYQSAAELRADLEDIRQQIEPTATHTSKWLLAGALFATLVLAITIFWWFHSPTSLSPNETIVIGIRNKTHDPAFNDALYVPLGIALEQTPYFTVLPLTKAVAAFSALHLSGDPMKLSPQTARQVCVQTNSRLVIAGSVVEAGNGFGIELQAIECQTGKTIATASGEARTRAQVVPALGLRAVELRAKLGEPQASIARFNKPLAEAASASPEALAMLLEGYKRNLLYDLRGAVSSYQRALKLDPNLAAALTALAAAQNYLGEGASSVAAIKKAYQLGGHLTDPVRFHAESLYYDIVTGELEKECAILLQSVQRFPDDFTAHTNFRQCLQSLGQLDRALAEAREASRLYPSSFSYRNVIFLDVLTDRRDEAEAEIAEADTQHFDSVNLRYDRALLAFLQHDNSKLEAQWRWAEGKPDADYLMLYQRALAEAYRGRYRNFRYLSARAKQLAIEENTLFQSSWITNNDALTEAEAGNISEALDLAERGLTGPQYRTRRAVLALAFARAGRITRAEELAESINKSAPLHTLVQNYVLPTIQAVIRIQAKDPAGAIKLLERTKQYDFAYPDSFRYLYPSYIRGLAYLQIGEWSLAKIEFQKLIDHPGMVGLSVTGVLSHLQLARALKLSGDAAAAGKAYEDFLSLWKDADPDIPIYQQAKAEYAQLSPLHTAR